MSQKVKAADLVVSLGLASSKSQATSLILAGQILSNDQPVTKAGQLLPPTAPLTLKEGRKYVSRGGFKLAGALAALGVDVLNFKVLDAGASTGGF
ncbi:MAG: TlyA family rRNA (cytidine-2'-O)-methyltransferase, partial [Deltaproteobacteria bacterium]|nr:TlyA family rRNA (cytidine-2'-O)-methyltransferase [Deltaproteobacteria bacterium]